MISSYSLHCTLVIGIEITCDMGSSSSTMVNVATFEVAQVVYVYDDYYKPLSSSIPLGFIFHIGRG